MTKKKVRKKTKDWIVGSNLNSKIQVGSLKKIKNELIKKEKENPFTTIEILKSDRQTLMDLAMRISVANNGDYSKPPYPATMVGYAVDALEHRVNPSAKTKETNDILMLSNHEQSKGTLH